MNMKENNCVKFRIGVKSYANYSRGLTLFGKKFGDHTQNIVIDIYNEHP